ncbi:MAG: lipocalin family protein [Aeromonadaceae bacterium]
MLIQRTLMLLVLALMLGCTGTPTGLTPVHDFDLNRYLGHWYEVARLDHSFERGLSQVTATYSLNPDGSVKVINRGYDADKQEWKEAQGKAWFVSSPNIGHLKVSFFGPFYGGYNILILDQAYQYALVSGPDRDYLWILSRSPQLPEATYLNLVAQAKQLGFASEQLLRVTHTPVQP